MKLIPETTRSIPPEYWENRSRFRVTIIKSAMPLVKSVARKYARGSFDRFEEFQAIALEALNAAIDDYDPDRASFSTHAGTKMRSAILHEQRRNSFVPRVWIEGYQKVVREAKKINNLRGQYNHPALSLREVAERLNIQEWDRIVAAMNTPNPIALVGFEQEYQSSHDEDDMVSQVQQVLFRLPNYQRKSIELWLFKDKRNQHFSEAFVAVKSFLLEMSA
jgi:RNA polymerase sigma factor (sigma-70 family)